MRAMLLMVCLTFALTGCDEGIDSEKLKPFYDYTQLSIDEKYTTTEENGMTISRDESGRVTGIYTFKPSVDVIDKLMNAPTSLEDIIYLFQLSEDYEIRLESTRENPAWEGLPDFLQYSEVYRQYYKGILVAPGGCQIDYFITPQGKRMSNAYIAPFINVKDLNITPSVTEKQARQVMADYLEEERDNNWLCNLSIREFSTRKDGRIVRDVRLVYSITGPYAPMEPDVWYCMAPRYYATVDAHTGQLLLIN